ncbi:hypothetical protein MKW94_023498 [Papaver nudicaule]|uniref:Cation-transporting P-type ATPase C-terminal domain-containing protein n=1 Tax=Papaver nudicaule TaxID=74823 RepID=A0AA41W0T3_PAPNU|nr:hypothetical protein [Papaver nudicaule]
MVTTTTTTISIPTAAIVTTATSDCHVDGFESQLQFEIVPHNHTYSSTSHPKTRYAWDRISGQIYIDGVLAKMKHRDINMPPNSTATDSSSPHSYHDQYSLTEGQQQQVGDHIDVSASSCACVSSAVTDTEAATSQLNMDNNDDGSEDEADDNSPVMLSAVSSVITSDAFAAQSSEIIAIDTDHSRDNMGQNVVDDNEDQSVAVPLISRALISKEILSSIVKDRNFDVLRELGGLEGVSAKLDTNLDHGICISTEDLRNRKNRYGSNIYGEELLNTSKSFFNIVLKPTLVNWNIFLLLCIASLSLGSGIKEEPGLKYLGWFDGAAIFVVTFLLVAIPAYRNYKAFRNSQNLLNYMEVLRCLKPQLIAVSEIVVGDVVFLKTGEWVPADGLYIDGEKLKVDDDDSRYIDRVENPFLCYGAKVVEGSGHMLVTSVGKSTSLGEMMMSTATNDSDKKKQSLFQVKLDRLNSVVQNISMILTILILGVTLLMKFLLRKRNGKVGSSNQINKRTDIQGLTQSLEKLFTKRRNMGRSLKTMLSLLLVGIQEGLPLVFTLFFFFWNEKMKRKYQVLIRRPCGGVKTGSITTLICTIEGLITSNQMEVSVFYIGGEEAKHGDDIASVTSKDVLEAIHDGLLVSTLPPVLISDHNLTSPTEDPLLQWSGLKLGMNDMELERGRRKVLAAKSFSFEKRRSVFLLKKDNDAEETIHDLHWKGTADTILVMCSTYYDNDGIIHQMDDEKRAALTQCIKNIDTKGLEPIAFACRRIEIDGNDDEIVDYNGFLYEDGLTWVGLLGVKYPHCSDEKSKAVADFLKAGVSIKLVSPQRLSVLKTIAMESGILQPTDLEAANSMIEGEEFRNLSNEDRLSIVDQIVVMGSSLPSDKLLFVQCLKKQGEIVAVTGTTLSDSPSLRAADVGILMGKKNINSEMAKENSGILIFVGSSLLINLITTISVGDSPFPSLQLLLVNLIVSSLAAFAMLTIPPKPIELLEMKPIKHSDEPFISKPMWRNILVHVCYQAVVLLTFQFIKMGLSESVKNAIIFNGFVLYNILNQFNARDIEKKNVFKGLSCIFEGKTYRFLVAVGVPVFMLVVVMEFAAKYTDVSKLNLVQWVICFIFAFTSLLVDCIGKYLLPSA